MRYAQAIYIAGALICSGHVWNNLGVVDWSARPLATVIVSAAWPVYVSAQLWKQ
jgi:hypothetical protein